MGTTTGTINSSRKRKLPQVELPEKAKRPTTSFAKPHVSSDDIIELEQAIIDSPMNYNYISSLLEHAEGTSRNPEVALVATVALCRTFCRIMASGYMSRQKRGEATNETIVKWLRERYNDYMDILFARLQLSEEAMADASLKMILRLLKEEGTHMKPMGDEYFFPQAHYGKLVKAILCAGTLHQSVKDEFLANLNEFDDMRHFFFVTFGTITEELRRTNAPSDSILTRLTTILLSITNPPTPSSKIKTLFAISLPSRPKSKPASHLLLSTHLKTFQSSWLSLLRLPLSAKLHKHILHSLSHSVIPSLPKPHYLLDYLLTSYTLGGALALLSLESLFDLITNRNLDFPGFYKNLYALLDRNLLHTAAYRSRFFRLLEKCLDSTHLPATLVASFIKKLARLSLDAPAPAVVIGVPLMYNLLRKHKTCSFMVHRIPTAISPAEAVAFEDTARMSDPFLEREDDPVKTGALDSCLWELVMLKEHWNPNVAAICGIVGEPFWKERYAVEDFLDHGYGSMFDTEVAKPVSEKRPPHAEEEVPKKIFLEEETSKNALLQDLWIF